MSAAVQLCKRGHERTPENTYRYRDGRTACRACCKAASQRNNAKLVGQGVKGRLKRNIERLDEKAFARLVQALRDDIPLCLIHERFGVPILEIVEVARREGIIGSWHSSRAARKEQR